MKGGATRVPIMTAYRQQALACAASLSNGPKRIRELKAVIPDAPKILLRNVYGWFARVGPRNLRHHQCRQRRVGTMAAKRMTSHGNLLLRKYAVAAACDL